EKLRLHVEERGRADHIGSRLDALSTLAGGFVDSLVVVVEFLATLQVLPIPSSRSQTLFGEELPLVRFRELEAVLDGVLEMTLPPAGWRGGLPPHEVFGEQETLIDKP